MNLYRTLLAAAISGLVLSGCSTIPDGSERPTPHSVGQDVVSGWTSVPAIEYRRSRQAIEIKESAPIPSHIYEKKINLNFNRELGIKDLMHILSSMDIPTVMATSELADVSFFIPGYRGTVGTFLDVVAASTDVSFDWKGGALLIDKARARILKIPQNSDVADLITATITSMGASDVKTSYEAGLVSYKASDQAQELIKNYLDRLAVNTAMVNLQVAVINVSLDDQKRSGFDWSSLSVKAGELDLLPNTNLATSGGDSSFSPFPDSDTDGSGNEGDDSGDGTSSGSDAGSVAQDLVTGAAMALSGQGVGVVFQRSNITLQGALNLLSTYGDSKTIQNLTLKTLSGVPVKLASGQSIPYVEDISLNVNDGGSTSGTSTSTVDTGFNIELNPLFDAEDRLVTIELNLSMKSFIGFRELSAGNQIGTLTRPETQDQSLENIARLEAGETALLGGLIYENLSDNRSSIRGLEKMPIASKSVQVTKNAMFILVRPTVVVYGPQERRNALPQVPVMGGR